MSTYSKVKASIARKEEAYKNSRFDLDSDPAFRAQGKNFKADIDMYLWIYTEISNLRMEVSRLGSYVRLNNKVSPQYLEAYHEHLYALMIPIGVLMEYQTWNKLDSAWIEIKRNMNDYFQERKYIPNKKIPFYIIRRLDKLYRLILLVAQKVGLGMRISEHIDTNIAIEAAISGEPAIL